MAFYVVAYDIPDDRRRGRLAKVLLDFGNRVQYSLFECSMDANLLARMEKRIVKLIDEKEDCVRIYALCGNCNRTIRIFGEGQVESVAEVYIV